MGFFNKKNEQQVQQISQQQYYPPPPQNYPQQIPYPPPPPNYPQMQQFPKQQYNNYIFGRNKYGFAQKHLALRAKYYITDPDTSQNVCYVERDFGLKIHAHFHVYTDDTKRQEVLTVKDLSIIDFGAKYEVIDPFQGKIGMFKRRGWMSFLRRSWNIMDADGNIIGEAKEDSWFKAFVRRFIPFGEFLKTDMDIYLQGQKIGKFIRKWTILDRYVLDLSSDVNGVFDRRMAVALGALLDAGDQR